MTAFVIYGKPQGKARPRFSNGHAYTPKQTTDYERQIKNAFIAAGGQMIESEGVIIEIDVYYKKTAADKKKTSPTKKPDIDNICKIVLDGLNGVAYADDKQVISLTANKYFAVKGVERVEVRILSEDE
ncbi:MAG: RusA family crossover junction endodeoxyribonuclease [Clostridia bacterium]|nr:RusA family crossover junction endodeoxyribonuclease [Clostridia bacterium]